jgi:hypothetical protein
MVSSRVGKLNAAFPVRRLSNGGGVPSSASGYVSATSRYRLTNDLLRLTDTK